MIHWQQEQILKSGTYSRKQRGHRFKWHSKTRQGISSTPPHFVWCDCWTCRWQLIICIIFWKARLFHGYDEIQFRKMLHPVLGKRVAMNMADVVTSKVNNQNKKAKLELQRQLELGIHVCWKKFIPSQHSLTEQINKLHSHLAPRVLERKT